MPSDQTRVKHRGSFYIRQTRWGPVAQKWPRKRPHWKNAVNLAQREQFKLMVRMQQNMSQADYVGAMGLQRGSLYVWRDVLTRALTARWIAFDPVSVATPQEILDSITDVVGALLVRTDTGWAGLLPDAAGKVLTDHGPGIPPSFEAPVGLVFTDRGAWDGSAAYDPGDMVQFSGTARCCWAHVSAAAGVAQAFSHSNQQGSAPTLSTTNTVDDTATNTAGGNNAIGGTAFQNSGKWYFELTWHGGLGNNSAITVSNVGRSVCSMRGQAIGNINGYGAGTGTGSWPGITLGNRLGCAVDFTAGLIWFCPNVSAGSLNWNGSTSNDPAAGTGGVSIGSDFTAHPGAPMVEFISATNEQAVLYTDPGSLAIASVPTGFSPWIAGALNPDPDSDPDHWFG